MSGYHLTAGRARLGLFLGHWLAVCGLIAVGWWCRGFQNIPEPLRQLAMAVYRWFNVRGYRVDLHTVAVFRGIYLAFYFILWLLLRVWRRLLTALVSPLLWRRSAVRFTAGRVTTGPFYRRRRFDRQEQDAYGPKAIAFLLQPDPLLDQRQAKPLPPILSVFYRQTQYLVVRHGFVETPVTSFGVKRDGDRFKQVCEFSLAYPLAWPAAQQVRGGASSRKPDENDDV